MALFVIADLHLSLSADKPMDVFPGWSNYVERLEMNWRRTVAEEDTVVLAGDLSWAMKLEDSYADFSFLHSLPGKKLLMKGKNVLSKLLWQGRKSLAAVIKLGNGMSYSRLPKS